jgi:pimeloyl-ACP methyl ester carboxylesterase
MNVAAPSLMSADPVTSITVSGVRVELIERGTGKPLLFLHPGIGIEPTAAVLDRLAAHRRVLAPVHPGFGRSEQPRSFDTVDDLAYFYLDLLDQLDLRDTVVVGVSFGGWIAAEMAIKSTARTSHLVLANAVGIKVGDRETRDIVDIWAIPEPEFVKLAYFDPAVGTRDYKAMPDHEVLAAARNREATARYAWSPYMHDPKLRGRLHRIRVPTLLLWGSADRILSESYGRAYAAAIPGARFEPIERAGHFPHLEQPQAFADKVFAFVDGR